MSVSPSNHLKRKVRQKMKIKLKLWDNKGKMMYSFTTTKRQLLYSRLSTHNFSKGGIKVVYQSNVFNDGEFGNITDAKWYLSTFTEKNLVEYCTKERFKL